jgi:hypothetical protein
LKFPCPSATFMRTDGTTALLDCKLPFLLQSDAHLGPALAKLYYNHLRSTQDEELAVAAQRRFDEILEEAEREEYVDDGGLYPPTSRERLQAAGRPSFLDMQFSVEHIFAARFGYIAPVSASFRTTEDSSALDSADVLDESAFSSTRVAAAAGEELTITPRLCFQEAQTSVNRVLSMRTESLASLERAAGVSAEELAELRTESMRDALHFGIRLFDLIMTNGEYSAGCEPAARSVWQSTKALAASLGYESTQHAIVDPSHPSRRAGSALFAFTHDSKLPYPDLSVYGNVRRMETRLFGPVMGLHGRVFATKFALASHILSTANRDGIREMLQINGAPGTAKSLMLDRFAYVYNRAWDPPTSRTLVMRMGSSSKTSMKAGGISPLSGATLYSDEALAALQNTSAEGNEFRQDVKSAVTSRFSQRQRTQLYKAADGSTIYKKTFHVQYSNEATVNIHNSGANGLSDQKREGVVPDSDRKALVDRMSSFLQTEQSVQGLPLLDDVSFRKNVEENKRLVDAHSLLVSLTYCAKYIISGVGGFQPVGYDAALKALTALDELLEREHGIPPPMDRQKSVRSDILLTKAVQTAVAKVFLFKESSVLWNVPSKDESGRFILHPFQMTDLTDAIRSACVSWEMVADAHSECLDRQLYAAPDTFWCMKALTQALGATQAQIYSEWDADEPKRRRCQETGEDPQPRKGRFFPQEPIESESEARERLKILSERRLVLNTLLTSEADASMTMRENGCDDDEEATQPISAVGRDSFLLDRLNTRLVKLACASSGHVQLLDGRHISLQRAKDLLLPTPAEASVGGYDTRDLKVWTDGSPAARFSAKDAEGVYLGVRLGMLRGVGCVSGWTFRPDGSQPSGAPSTFDVNWRCLRTNSDDVNNKQQKFIPWNEAACKQMHTISESFVARHFNLIGPQMFDRVVQLILGPQLTLQMAPRFPYSARTAPMRTVSNPGSLSSLTGRTLAHAAAALPAVQLVSEGDPSTPAAQNDSASNSAASVGGILPLQAAVWANSAGSAEHHACAQHSRTSLTAAEAGALALDVHDLSHRRVDRLVANGQLPAQNVFFSPETQRSTPIIHDERGFFASSSFLLSVARLDVEATAVLATLPGMRRFHDPPFWHKAVEEDATTVPLEAKLPDPSCRIPMPVWRFGRQIAASGRDVTDEDVRVAKGIVRWNPKRVALVYDKVSILYRLTTQSVYEDEDDDLDRTALASLGPEIDMNALRSDVYAPHITKFACLNEPVYDNGDWPSDLLTLHRNTNTRRSSSSGELASSSTLSTVQLMRIARTMGFRVTNVSEMRALATKVAQEGNPVSAHSAANPVFNRRAWRCAMEAEAVERGFFSAGDGRVSERLSAFDELLAVRCHCLMRVARGEAVAADVPVAVEVGPSYGMFPGRSDRVEDDEFRVMLLSSML